MGSLFVGAIHESPAVSGLMMVMNDTDLSYYCMESRLPLPLTISNF